MCQVLVRFNHPSRFADAAPFAVHKSIAQIFSSLLGECEQAFDDFRRGRGPSETAQRKQD